MASPTNREELIEANEIILELERRKKYNKFKYTFPDEGDWNRGMYPYAVKFFDAGAKYRSRAVIAGNRIGKSFMAAYEVTCHLTGLYPSWWTGRVFKHPVEVWAAGVSNESTKDVLQKVLFGKFLDPGTGLIPKDLLVKTTNRQGCPETILTGHVKHYTDGIYDGDSEVTLKSYEQGPDKFMGTAKHVIWLDEEPANPLIYGESKMRTTKTTEFPGGLMICTFTPLDGLTELVLSFMPGGVIPLDNVHPETGAWAMHVSWDECPHLTEEEKAEQLKDIPPYLRDARTKGIPHLGAGAIYQVNWADVVVEPFDPPDYWQKCYALDVGWRKTAALWAAQDPADGVWYIYSEHYVSNDIASAHAEAIKRRGSWIPGVIDPAANRTRDDGTRLLEQYMELGLELTPSANSIEAGISEVWQAFMSGNTKIFSTCQALQTELRLYHRKENGQIPDEQADHLCDCIRYLHLSGFSRARVNPDYESRESLQYSDADKYDLGASSTTGY